MVRRLYPLIAYGLPTHSLSPSANRWCFQIGTVAFSSSIRARHASNASARCEARHGHDDGQITDGQVTDAVYRGDGVQAELLGDLVGDAPQLIFGGRVRGVGQAGDLAVVIFVPDRPREERDATRGRICDGGPDLVHRQFGLTQRHQAHNAHRITIPWRAGAPQE